MKKNFKMMKTIFKQKYFIILYLLNIKICTNIKLIIIIKFIEIFLY